MSKRIRVSIAMVVAAAMLLLCGGDTYAYKAEWRGGGHRHIATEAAKMYLLWRPELAPLFEGSYNYNQNVGGHVPRNQYIGHFDLPGSDDGVDVRQPGGENDDKVRELRGLTALELIQWGQQNEDEFDYVYNSHKIEIDFIFDVLRGVVTTYTHFWDADEGPLEPSIIEETADIFDPKPNSWMKVGSVDPLRGNFARGLSPNVSAFATALGPSLWDRAINAWALSEEMVQCEDLHQGRPVGNQGLCYKLSDEDRNDLKAEAFVWLGHVAHHIQDMTVPAHALMDAHGPRAAAGFYDGYEEWSSVPDADRDPASNSALSIVDGVGPFADGAIPALFDPTGTVTDWYDDLWYSFRNTGQPWEPAFWYAADWYSDWFTEDLNPFILPTDKEVTNVLALHWGAFPENDRHRLQLFYLLYTANQHGDYFDSWHWSAGGDANFGDVTEPTLWLNGYPDADWPEQDVIPEGRTLSKHRDPREIANKNYRYAIRATAALYELFFTEVGALLEFECPDDITLPCGSETKPDITDVATAAPSAFVTFSDVLDLDDMGLVGTITRTWTAKNEFGITETCDQIITIENTTPLTIFLSGTGTDLGIDNDADGAFDFLQVNLAVSLVNAHNLSLSARLIDSADPPQVIDISSNDFGFFPAGPVTISLSFDGNKIGVHGVDGPYTVTDLVFNGSECDVLSVDYITNSYAASEFSGFPAMPTTGIGVGGNGGCFVATAAYGTPMAEDIHVLRRFRDEVLLTSPLGTLFVDGYYRTSPPIADFVTQHPAAASTVRIALIPLLFVLSSPWTAAVMVLLLAGALLAGRQVRGARHRSTTGILFLILALLAFSTPVQAHVALTDASGLQFLIATDPREPTDSVSAAAVEAEYTTSVTVSTTGGGTTMARPGDAFDGYGGVFIVIEPVGEDIVAFKYTDNGPGTLIDGGRSILFGTQTFFDDFLVTREVFVPEDDEFCRWLTRIRNVGTDIASVTVRPINNLGSDISTVIHATSDGDALVTTNDNWAVSYDSETEPGVPDGKPTYVDPRLGHVFQNTGAPVQLQSINFVDGDDTPVWEYDSVEILPGEVVTFMHFVTGQPNLPDAVSKVLQLEALQGSALDFMSAEEISQVVNFVPQQSGAAILGAATGLVEGFGESSLYSIDPDTGEATEIGPIGFDNVSGMAFVGERLLATARGDDIFGGTSAILIEIDPETGAGTLIGEVDNNVTGDCGRMPGLTYDAATDTLFAYGSECGSSKSNTLWTIDPVTGLGNLVGPSSFTGNGNGLAVQPGTGTLFATPTTPPIFLFFLFECLVTINRDTGAGTCIAGSAGDVQRTVNALDFHPITGRLYGSQQFHIGGGEFVSRLVLIGVSDGTTAAIGETVLGLDAIVFILEEAEEAVVAGAAGSSNPCVVATAAYGTPMEQDINALRHFRDEVLLTSPLGTLFVDGYYRTSPPIADFVAKHPAAASTLRIALIPLLFVLSSPWTAAATVLLLAGALLTRRQVRTARLRMR